MNYFFGFNNYLSESVDWFFNLNHLMLILMIATFIVACCFIFSAKSEKGKRITRIILAIILLVLEVGRTIYKYRMHIYNGGTASDFNWWWNISFQMCAIMCWTTIITLILSACLKKENVFLQYLYNILFACAMVGGFLTFMYPDCITSNYPILHFINIQTILVHALLIFVPIYLIKIKEFKVEFKNAWKVFVGYVFVGAIAMSASLISGNNFAFSLNLDLFDLGIPFPWHMLFVMIVMACIAFVLYGAFELVRFIRRKVKKEQKQISMKTNSNTNKLGLAIYIVSIACAILFGAIIILSIANIIGEPLTWAGAWCLIGFVYMLLLLVFAETNKKYINNSLDMEHKAKHITLIVLTFIFALPVGIIYLIRFLKEKNDVQRLVDGRE